MKELNSQKMENLEGGANARCFLFGAAACVLSFQPLGGASLVGFCSACLYT
jgi:hypothetical protein